ncbi:MAG: hypothetical protein AB7S26_34160 [Sandaracinaceae bacterium]
MRRVDEAVETRRPERQPKLKRRTPLAWLRESIGHATTETLIMIPIFIAIWGGIWYTHQRYRAAINMAQFTRAHTWSHAFDACEGPTGTTSVTESETSDAGFVGGVVDLLFGDGLIPGMRFHEVEGQRETSVDKPAVLGEGTVNMRHNIVMLCNEPLQGDRSFWEVAWAMFFG